MSEPRFKVGDEVQYLGEGEVMTIGIRVEPLRLASGAPFFVLRPNDYCYTFQEPVADLHQGPRVLPESALTRVEQWEPCPGRHRVVGGSWEGYRNVERLVE